MRKLTPAILQHLRDTYPKGARVSLDQMDDVQAPPIGTEGTVFDVDPQGTIHVLWDNGSTFGVAWPEDRCHKIADQKVIPQP